MDLAGVPEAEDEYHQRLRAFPRQETKAAIENPVWHIHSGTPPESDMIVPYAMLLNLASVASAETSETLWGFIRRYAPEAGPETHPGLDAAAGRAVRYYQDHVKPAKQYRAPSADEAAALTDLADRLEAAEAGADAEALQTIVYAVGKERGIEPLRDWFTTIYEVLLGQSQGPRFGGFIAVYGLSESIALIRAGAKGELADKA